MHAIRHRDESASAKLAPARRRQVDVIGGTGHCRRRVAEPPGAAVVLAPFLGLLVWGLIALLVF